MINRSKLKNPCMPCIISYGTGCEFCIFANISQEEKINKLYYLLQDRPDSRSAKLYIAFHGKDHLRLY